MKQITMQSLANIVFKSNCKRSKVVLTTMVFELYQKWEAMQYYKKYMDNGYNVVNLSKDCFHFVVLQKGFTVKREVI